MKKLVLLLILFTNQLLAQDNKISFSANIIRPNSDSIVVHNKNFKITIKGKDGKFSESFNAPQGFYQLFDGSEFANLYLSGGFILELKADGKRFSETLSFDGNGAMENNYLLKKKAIDKTMKQGFGGKLPSEEELKIVLKKRFSEAKNYLYQEGFSPSFSNLMLAEYQLEDKRIIDELKNVTLKTSGITSLEGKIAPNFEYANHKGGKTTLSSLTGKYVFLDIWATWCAPCRAEIPYLKKLEQHYKTQNIVFVSISVDKQDDYEKWIKFVNDEKLGGIQLFADKDFSSEWVKAFKIDGIPRFILIDPIGKIHTADAPRPSSPDLKMFLDKLLTSKIKEAEK